MAKRVSTYLKELQKIEKNGDEDLTTKYDHLYHIINQSKDAEAIKEAYAIIENIKKATIKKEIASLKTTKDMLMFAGGNIFEQYCLDFPEETEDESEDPKLYFVLKNTYNEITEYYTSIIKYCNEYAIALPNNITVEDAIFALDYYEAICEIFASVFNNFDKDKLFDHFPKYLDSVKNNVYNYSIKIKDGTDTDQDFIKLLNKFYEVIK